MQLIGEKIEYVYVHAYRCASSGYVDKGMPLQQVVGRQIKKGPLRPEKRKIKKIRPAERQVKPLPLITLSLEEGPNHTLHAQRDPARDPPGTITRHCSLLDCRKYTGGSMTSLPISSAAESSEAEDDDSRLAKTLLSTASEGKHSNPVFPDVARAATIADYEKNKTRDTIEERSESLGPKTRITSGKINTDKVISSLGS